MVLKIRSITSFLLIMMLCPGIVDGIPLLEAISEAEGTSDEMALKNGFASGYDVTVYYKKYISSDVPLTEMTIEQVQKFQRDMVIAQRNSDAPPKVISGAVGKYQITEGTLADLLDRVFKNDPEITSKTLFNAETQEKLAQALLIKRRYDEWLTGTIEDEEFQKNLKLEWAAIPDPVTGTGYYKGQTAGTTTDKMKKAMEETRDVITTSGTLYDTAFFFYSKAVVLANQGDVLTRNGKYDEAKQAFDEAKQAIDEAIRLRPNFAEAIKKQSEIESHVGSVGSPWGAPEETTLHAALAFLGIGVPMLSPSDSGIIWFSDQSKDAPETSGDKTYFDKANDVWYVDAFEWSGDRSQHSKPAAPYRFISGERNTFGYNWIYLPYERTGLWYNQGYEDWVTETLASMGMSGPTAGYGRLM